MIRVLTIFYLCCISQPLLAQVKKTLALPVTGYLVKANDSVQIVQVKLPDGLQIENKTPGILRPVHTKGDTAIQDIGTGKCQLIKGNYYYYGLHTGKGSRSPKEGDLLYTTVGMTSLYEGLLFPVIRHHITITSVEERTLANLAIVLALKNAAAEQAIIDSLVKDVQYTGLAMQKENNNQDMLLEDGLFKGKKLFAAMQMVNAGEVTAFLKYIAARPRIYAGNTWKFSEIFATWMAGGTPTVKE